MLSKLILSALAAGVAFTALTTEPTAAPALSGLPVLGDFDNDGDCDIADLINFNTLYNAGDLAADMNFNCIVDVGDIVRIYQYYYPAGNATVLDRNFDGNVDVADVVTYTSEWNAGLSIANVNGDCAVDIADLSVWMGLYTNQ